MDGRALSEYTHLLPWFVEHGYLIEWVALDDAPEKKAMLANGSILLLENLRFYEGKKKLHLLHLRRNYDT